MKAPLHEAFLVEVSNFTKSIYVQYISSLVSFEVFVFFVCHFVPYVFFSENSEFCFDFRLSTPFGASQLKCVCLEKLGWFPTQDHLATQMTSPNCHVASHDFQLRLFTW